jgi:probable HAF family extracellular repeat protein
VEDGGSFSAIDVPFAGATATEANGINSAGQIVGTYNDQNRTHGFLAAPAAIPEPPSLLLLAFALTALVFRVSRLHRLPW